MLTVIYFLDHVDKIVVGVKFMTDVLVDIHQLIFYSTFYNRFVEHLYIIFLDYSITIPNMTITHECIG